MYRATSLRSGIHSKPGLLRRGDERLCTADNFACPTDRDRAASTVGDPGEIQVGLDGTEVIDDVLPRPPGHRVAVEVGGKPRQKYPPLTAPEPPTVAPRMIVTWRAGRSVSCA